MKKTSVLTSPPSFDSIGNMKFRPTYIRHICYLCSPKFWQLIGDYVPKVATCMSFAVLYICIHILNTLNAGLGGRHGLVSAFMLQSSAHSQSSALSQSWSSNRKPPEIKESKFRNQDSGIRIHETKFMLLRVVQKFMNKSSLFCLKNWLKNPLTRFVKVAKIGLWCGPI